LSTSYNNKTIQQYGNTAIKLFLPSFSKQKRVRRINRELFLAYIIKIPNQLELPLGKSKKVKKIEKDLVSHN